MKKIAALIDFTPTCEVTIAYSIHFAKALGAEVVLLHIAENEEDKASAADNLQAYKNEIAKHGIHCSTHLETGAFNAMVDATLQLIGPELVIAGTHGIQGLKQTLFGAHILKLAQNVSVPLLVVQDNSKISNEGIKNILFSMGSHTGFEARIEWVALLAMLLQSKVTIYTIVKSQLGIGEELHHNNNYAKGIFNEMGVPCDHIIDESHDHSLGYSRQTINYMENHPFDMLVMAADPSDPNSAFSKTDKENLLLNTLAVPVLCV